MRVCEDERWHKCRCVCIFERVNELSRMLFNYDVSLVTNCPSSCKLVMKDCARQIYISCNRLLFSYTFLSESDC